jgi:hypothetical protein
VRKGLPAPQIASPALGLALLDTVDLRGGATPGGQVGLVDSSHCTSRRYVAPKRAEQEMSIRGPGRAWKDKEQEMASQSQKPRPAGPRGGVDTGCSSTWRLGHLEVTLSWPWGLC